MSYVIAAPEMMTAAAADLANIGSDVSAAHLAAAAPTVALVPAAADEVSKSIAHLFSQHGADYQTLAGRAATFHEDFVQNLTAGAHSYAGAEAINIEYLIWLAENAGLYQVFQYLSEIAASNSVIFQLLQNFVQPLRFLLGGVLLLFVLVAGGILSALASFLGMFGL